MKSGHFTVQGRKSSRRFLFHSQHRTVTAVGLSAWSPPVPCSCGRCLQRLQICNYRSRGDGAAGIWWLARQCVRALPVTPEVWQLRKPWCGLHGNRPVFVGSHSGGNTSHDVLKKTKMMSMWSLSCKSWSSRIESYHCVITPQDTEASFSPPSIIHGM